MRGRKFCGWLLRVLGWTAVEPLPEEKKCIMLGVPHTTVWDFFISYLYFKSIGGDGLCMIKKEMFFPPLGWIVRAMGGIPVDRSNPSAIVRSVLREMETRKHFHLAIAPEGTRKPVARWKSGYHLIARAADIPVYLCYFDWKRKRIGCGQKFELTDDAAADTRRMQQLYEAMDLGGRHPEKYRTH